MIYRSDKYLNCLLLHVYCFMPELYVYYLIWTKCIHNLCVHSYMRIIDSFYKVWGVCTVYIQTRLNVDGGNNSLDSGQFFNAACINLTTLLMIDRLQYQMKSSWRNFTSASKGASKPLQTNIFYVDRWGSTC